MHTALLQGLREAAIPEVLADKELARRAIETSVVRRIRKQENREAVARKAIEYIRNDPPDASTLPPSDDWMNFYEDRAENASSEKMRELWGRILAGELRKPKSVSLRSLHFFSVLDEDIAKAVELCASRLVGGNMIPGSGGYSQKEEGDGLASLTGLGVVSQMAVLNLAPLEKGPITLWYGKNHAIHITGQKRGILSSYFLSSLTPLGREIISIVSVDADLNFARFFVDDLSNMGVSVALVTNKGELVYGSIAETT